jgi:transposase
MTPEQLFHELLGLGGHWRVTRCEHAPKDGSARGDLNRVVRLWIKETPELWNGESIAAGEAAWPRVDWSGVVFMVCDELSVRKAHHYVGVFCDLIGRRVLFATPGKKAATWGAFVTALGEHNGPLRTITEVSIEMGPAYIAGVCENLGAQAARYVGLVKSNLASVKAHQMRRILPALYAIPDVALARRKPRAWCRWVRWTAAKHTPALFAPMARTARIVERHIEALNRVFSAVKRKARGFRSFKNLISRLYFTAGRLDLPATH